mmetsp:Transcript_52037/g.71029  ORF Transcript_52037/g.71029 Transcript_52037/m.71029 type:complete len:200 (+) Transcript_52037:1124-1723(+)
MLDHLEKKGHIQKEESILAKTLQTTLMLVAPLQASNQKILKFAAAFRGLIKDHVPNQGTSPMALMESAQPHRLIKIMKDMETQNSRHWIKKMPEKTTSSQTKLAAERILTKVGHRPRRKSRKAVSYKRPSAPRGHWWITPWFPHSLQPLLSLRQRERCMSLQGRLGRPLMITWLLHGSQKRKKRNPDAVALAPLPRVLR